MDFIGRVWRGEASLTFTYWIVGVVGNGVFQMTELSLAASGYDAQMTAEKASVIQGLIIASTAYFLWSAVCIWRSASNHTGSRAWAAFVKLSLLGGAVTVLWKFAVAVVL